MHMFKCVYVLGEESQSGMEEMGFEQPLLRFSHFLEDDGVHEVEMGALNDADYLC